MAATIPNWWHEPIPPRAEPADVTRIAWTPPPRAELRPLPRVEPDPPMSWRLAFAWWAVGFVTTLSVLSVLVGWIGELA